MRRAFAGVLVAVTLSWAQPARAQQSVTVPVESETATRGALTKQLVKLGLEEREAQSRVARLPLHEVQQLVENPKQLGMGGIQDRTLIIIALILIIPSVLLLVAI